MSRHCKVRGVACLSLCCRQCPKLERLVECLYTVRLSPSHTCLFLPVVVSLNLLLLFFVFPHFICSFCPFSLSFFVVYPSFSLNMFYLPLNFAIFSIRNKKLVEAIIFSENNPHLKKTSSFNHAAYSYKLTCQRLNRLLLFSSVSFTTKPTID
jgi:hypothetical protein